MLDSGRSMPGGWHLLLGLVPGVVCLCVLAGCGGESSNKPAAIDATQQKKVQEYLGGYRESLIAEAKSRAKTKSGAKDAVKKKQ